MKKLLILIIAFASGSLVYSQTSVEYEVVYNSNTGLYEAYAHVIGDALTFPSNISGTASFTIVLPTGVIPPSALAVTTVNPPGGPTWTNSNTVSGPAITPGLEYRFISKSGGGTFTSFADGDDILLFTFSLGGSCVGNVRVFNNDTDPNSAQLGGGNFSNSFQNFVVGELYAGNRNNDGTACIFVQDVSGPWDIASNWIDNQVPTINDDAIIDAGVVSYLRQDQAVNNLELRPGSTVSIPNSGNPLDPYTLNIVGNIQNDGDFTLYNANQSGTPGAPTGTNGNPNVDGEVLLNGPATQILSGTGNYYNLRVDNSNGVDVDNAVTTDPTEINGVLTVDTGAFSTNNNVLLPCFFEEVPAGSGDFKNGRAGQIGPIGVGGSITGDVSVEQCYPGRRAFRYVSASTTTTNSIQDNWQENATAYNNVPVPNATQVDVSPIINGIEYGFGTHITGVTHGNGNALGQEALDGTDGLDWQPSGNASMFAFDEDTQSFNPVLVTESATEQDNLVAGKAYNMMIRGSRQVNLTSNASPTYNTKLRSTGTPAQGNISLSSTFPVVDINNRKFIFIGNPFHAIVDMIDVQAASTGIASRMYAFDPTLGGQADVNPDSSTLGGRGAFVTIDFSALPATGMKNYLQAYQGVFVEALVTNPTINFSETHKSVVQEQIDVFSTPGNRIELRLYDQVSYTNNSTRDDITVINFNPNENNTVDFDDALKFFNPDENVGRLEGNSLLSIENRAMPQIDEVLELYTTNYRTTNYIFVAKVDGLLDNTVYLYDNYTNTETVLNSDASTAVNFTVDPANPASIATDRFEIRFETSTLGTTEFDLQGISVYPNPASDILNINLGDNTGRFDSLELFDIRGRLVATKNLSNQVLDVQMDVNGFSSGVYFVKVSSGSEQFSTKVIIE